MTGSSDLPTPARSGDRAALRVALKVDCDTFVGTRDGVPRLLEIFRKRRIRATFFFTLGPDRSGVAVRRVLTRPGFLRKMLRSRGASLYGLRTALSGTLLPAPLIGKRCAEILRSVEREGHETGVHAWDHVGWHDGLDRMSEEQVREAVSRAHETYREILGHSAIASAAAGWTVDARSLEAEAARSLLYTSNTRGGRPFFPSAGGRAFPTLEVPSTLPTLDETLAWPTLRDDGDQRRFFREVAAPGTQVHTIHAEVEGRSKAALFEGILDDWIGRGATFPLLSELAREALADRARVPTREIVRTTLEGRGGTVATGWPEEAGA